MEFVLIFLFFLPIIVTAIFSIVLIVRIAKSLHSKPSELEVAQISPVVSMEIEQGLAVKGAKIIELSNYLTNSKNPDELFQTRPVIILENTERSSPAKTLKVQLGPNIDKSALYRHNPKITFQKAEVLHVN